MIGVFDSGVGGICAFREIRRLLPRENIIYLADRRNAPYGTKSEEEVTALTKASIKRLKERGAEKILIACCTASSVYENLDEAERRISLPIIKPAAIKAASGRCVLVIATERTVASGIFAKEIGRLSDARVEEFAAQRLVYLVENGCRDGKLNAECERELETVERLVKELRADRLILGCTHFSHLKKELFNRCRIRIISPAREGALALVKTIKASRLEGGRTIYM